MCSITSLETTSSHCPTDGSAMTSRERDVGNAARAFATGSTDRSKAVTAFDDSATLTRPLRRCGRVAVRDRRARALLVDELGVPVDRVVDARHTAVGAGDVLVTVDDRTMREEQPALFPAHPTRTAAVPQARFRDIAAHGGWRALAGPACR